MLLLDGLVHTAQDDISHRRFSVDLTFDMRDTILRDKPYHGRDLDDGKTAFLTGTLAFAG